MTDDRTDIETTDDALRPDEAEVTDDEAQSPPAAPMDEAVQASSSPDGDVLEAAAEAEAREGVEPEPDESAPESPEGDPREEIVDAEDPEAAARAALGLGERAPDEEEIAPEEAQAILRPDEPEPADEEVLEEPEAGLEDADLLDIYDEEPSEPSPYDRPGDWYVVHTYSGYEKKVKSNLESRIKSLNMEDRIYEIVIPMDDVIEFKGGKKTVVQKKVFPGYLLTRMRLDDDSWQAVRNTPGVTGFVGSGAKPTPLSRKEVESILRVRPEDEPKKARPRLEYEVGDQVRVTAGPFADFNGMIDEINVDQNTLKVLVNIFGRETPVTLDFADVAKL